MVRIGCLPIADSFSHIQSMACIASELQDRGHDIVFFGIADTIATLSKCSSTFQTVTFAEESMPLGHMAKLTKDGASKTGLASLQFATATLVNTSEVLFNEATSKIMGAELDIFVTDQVSMACSTLGDHLGIPYVSIASALLMIEDVAVPPIFSARGYSNSYFGQVVNAAETFITDLFITPFTSMIASWRTKWNLPAIQRYQRGRNSLSPYAVIVQMPAAFDLPYTDYPAQVHRIVRWTLRSGADGLAKVDPTFSLDRAAEGEGSLVYASLGTMMFNHTHIFREIISACKSLGVRLILSTGMSNDSLPDDLQSEQSDRIMVVNYCPQAQVLPLADVVVTHAGLNTTLMALTHGIPLVAIPLASDQPAVGARIEHHKVGVVVGNANVSASAIENGLDKVLNDTEFKARAIAMKMEFGLVGDVTKAADIVEEVVETKEPVLTS